jgi:undecaprenyl-diphosphatase
MGLVGRISRATGIGARTQLAIAALGLAFAALAGAVAAGWLSWVDQPAVDRLMPTLDPSRHRARSSRGFFLPFSWHIRWWAKVLDVWAYPCSVLISALILVAVTFVLRRRRRPGAALALISAWVVGDGIEVVGKGLLERPALFKTVDGARLHVTVFDQSFPSGHMMRCTIVAAAIVLVWRRAAGPVLAWALLVPVCLVLTAAHAPSDVAGGALLGGMMTLLALAIGDSIDRSRATALGRSYELSGR